MVFDLALIGFILEEKVVSELFITEVN